MTARRTSSRLSMLALIMVAQATQAAVQQGIPAIGPLLQARHHLDLSQTGLALSAVPLGILCTMLVWGFVADRVGSRYMVATSLIGTAGGAHLPDAKPQAPAWTRPGRTRHPKQDHGRSPDHGRGRHRLRDHPVFDRHPPGP